MARRVYLHIGLPKTATTYLQSILWANRDKLEQQGLLLPGTRRREHYWVSRSVREEPAFEKASEHQRGVWERFREDAAHWPGTVLISHEFLAAAAAEQAASMVADLAPAEVHLVVTAREPLGLFAASWQESIKNRETTPMQDYSGSESDDSSAVWNWRALDVRLVLQRWAPAFPAHRVHVLPLPDGAAPRRTIWDRFARLIDVDPDSVDLGDSFANSSMGVVEAETLRRMNEHLGGFSSSIDRGTYIRTFLADERLVPRDGERFWPAPEQVVEIRARGREAVEHISAQGYDVIGSLESLLVPAELPQRRVPESVTDAEVAEVAVQLAAQLLHDIRDLRHERRGLRRQLAESREREDPGLRVGLSRRFPVLRHLLLHRGGDRGEVPDADALQGWS